MTSSGEAPSQLSGLEIADADIPLLVDVWLSSLEAVADLAGSLTQAQWQTASPCPGWSAGDVVAHVLALESEFHGDPYPQHQPDWGSLPHASTPVGRYMEVPVDWRRSRDRASIVAELREVIELRRKDLTPAPTDPDEQVAGPAGISMDRRKMICTRILDNFVHEQDIRQAAGLPGSLDTDQAWVTAGRFASAIPFVWGKRVAAPVGSSLTIDITGPGVQFTRSVKVAEDGRARFIEGPRPQSPTVLLRCSWPVYVMLAAGRTGAVASAHGGAAEVAGDPELVERLLPALAITP